MRLGMNETGHESLSHQFTQAFVHFPGSYLLDRALKIVYRDYHPARAFVLGPRTETVCSQVFLSYCMVQQYINSISKYYGRSIFLARKRTSISGETTDPAGRQRFEGASDSKTYK